MLPVTIRKKRSDLEIFRASDKMPLLYQEEIIFLLAIEIGLSNGMDRKVYRSVEHLNFIGAYLSPSSWAWFDICSGSTYRLAETHNNLDTPNTYSLAASPPAR